MASEIAIRAPALPPRPEIPGLENGDRLTRPEFERRYAAMPHVKKAELVEGVVFMPSRAGLANHAVPEGELMSWLGWYKAATPGVEVAHNATVRLDMENELQPDCLLRIMPAAGGQSRTSADDFVEGAPELIAEISASSVSYDLHQKKRACCRNEVREYLVWLTQDKRIEWWALHEGDYASLPCVDGIIKSRMFPGLWLDTAALLTGDSAKVLSVLQAGLSTPDHVAFAAQLQSRLAQRGSAA